MQCKYHAGNVIIALVMVIPACDSANGFDGEEMKFFVFFPLSNQHEHNKKKTR